MIAEIKEQTEKESRSWREESESWRRSTRSGGGALGVPTEAVSSFRDRILAASNGLDPSMSQASSPNPRASFASAGAAEPKGQVSGLLAAAVAEEERWEAAKEREENNLAAARSRADAPILPPSSILAPARRANPEATHSPQQPSRPQPQLSLSPPVLEVRPDDDNDHHHHHDVPFSPSP